MSAFSDDGHVRFWAMVTVSAGTPTLQSSYNVTSITDTATGQLTITLTVPFTTANWSCRAGCERTSTSLLVANARNVNVRNGGLATGTVLLECNDGTAVTLLAADPASWHASGFGVQ